MNAIDQPFEGQWHVVLPLPCMLRRVQSPGRGNGCAFSTINTTAEQRTQAWPNMSDRANVLTIPRKTVERRITVQMLRL